MFVPPRDLSDLVRDEFTRLHSQAPASVARASGRVNLIGEHVDYLGGRCMPIALPYATWVACTPREDERVVLTSGLADRWEGARSDAGEGWARYVLGALAESSHDGGITLHVESTVPVGSGLSSSAALICAVLRAVDERSNLDLVEPAIRAETVHVGAPTGGLDQTAALLSTLGHTLLLDFAGGRPVQLPWQPSTVGLELLIIDTGVRHSNDDGAFALIRARSEAAMAASPEHLSAELAAARRHVVRENERVQQVVDALVQGDWHEIGQIFTSSHESLRDDLGVSCPELDTVVEAATGGGALGARMTGGGFGGCALILAPITLRDQVVAAVGSAFRARGWTAPTLLLGDAEGPATRLG